MPDAGELIVVQFPGAVATKRRPAVVLSSAVYHSARPDMIVGLITSQIQSASGPTDYVLVDWSTAGLHVASAFRAYLVTLPRSSAIAPIGRLSSGDWNAIQERVRRTLVVI
jgi:mRNA interferase MazF